MDPVVLVLCFLFGGIAVALIIWLLAARRSSIAMDQMGATFTATQKRIDELGDENASLAGEIAELKMKQWCDEKRPKRFDLKEFQKQ